uniref:FAM69 protein-kinase domain-containing protein n=1 Tax=Setaria digitata TaxID=48799 RepID=A0A915PII4_9BILA
MVDYPKPLSNMSYIRDGSVEEDSEDDDDDDDDGELFDCCSCLQASSGSLGASTVRLFFCSKPGRIMAFLSSLLVLYVMYLSWSNSAIAQTDVSATVVPTNHSRAHKVLLDLCNAYAEQKISGDLCNRICYHKKWNILDIYEGNKIVITIKDGGQEVILKSQHLYINDFDHLDPRVNESLFFDAILDIVNYNLKLGWPTHYKHHLIEILWPMYVRKGRDSLSAADRRSLWALLSQDEYITFRVLLLTRVTPKIIGTCGHFYQVETLVPFHMKGYYMNLKAKILLHLMGTLKLFDEFLNEPLQWCDIKFDNLGLAADYPKRYVIYQITFKSRADKSNLSPRNGLSLFRLSCEMQ